MGYPTASTAWPSPQPSPEMKELVDTFFALADCKDDNVGERLANEVFTADGIFVLPNGTFEGSSDISKSRKDAWKTIASRQHEVIKVYSNISGSTTDLFVVGRLAMETVTGAASRKEFVARMEIEHVHAVGPRLRQYRIVNPVPSDVRPLLC